MDADRPEAAPDDESTADAPAPDVPAPDVAAADEPASETPGRKRGGRAIGGVRAVAALLLVVIGTLSLTVAAPAIWGRNVVLDTDRYVKTVAPLATDPGVQDAVIAAVTKHVTDNIDVSALVTNTLPAKAKILSGPLQSATDGLVEAATTKFVHSAAFPALWDTVNRVAHKQLVLALTAQPPAGTVAPVVPGRVFINLAPVVGAVKKNLVKAGLTVAANVPPGGTLIEVADLGGLQKARHAVRVLDKLAVWLPWIGLGALVLAVVVTRRRRRMLIIIGLSVATGMAVVGLGVLIARHAYVHHVPAAQLSNDVAAFVFNTMVRYLRMGLRAVFLLALLLAGVAWLAGGSRPAGEPEGPTRSRIAVFLGRFFDSTGPVVQRHRRALRISVIAGGVLVLMLWTDPGWVLLTVVVAVVIIVLLMLEVTRGGRNGPEAPLQHAE